MISTILWVSGAVVVVLSIPAALALGRIIRNADENAQPEWDDACTCGAELTDWSQPEYTDVLGDVDARFWQIADDLRRTA